MITISNNTAVQKVHHLLDVALLLVDGLVLFSFKSYLERAIRMAFSARAMRFVTLSRTMRRLAGALFQTIVPILTVLGFCASPPIHSLTPICMLPASVYACTLMLVRPASAGAVGRRQRAASWC